MKKRGDMTIHELESILRKERIFEEFGISRLGLFGSFARGEEYRDIDILLEQNVGHRVREQLKEKLQAILNIKVDLVPEKFADPIILHRARKDLKYVTR
ncbi:nucleotidyltransferase family protein [Dyadobacter beijingensis]|uniref:nucleotidyltransferase family protein n=1 Tax=Dyadobacter beijingensis TaxID=365489 RepID=UPI001E590DC7|nr:nucleotidyltransferase domain-containing protein [Dyadobacter beijingensis]